MANITFSEGSGLNDSVFGKSQAPIRMFIEKKGETFEQESMIPLLFSQEKSSHWAEKYTSMTAMDGFQAVGENGAVPSDGMQEGYSQTIENMTFKDAFSISREIMEDSKSFDLRKKPEAFITGYHRTRETFAGKIYAEAIGSSASFRTGAYNVNLKAADGKTLFNTGHTAKKKTSLTQSNLFSDAFSADALAAVECAMQNFKGDNGEILAVVPDTIMIPNQYALKKAVFAAIGADRDPATANNAFNFLFGRWHVIVNPYLNGVSGSPWVLLSSAYNKEYGGAIWQDRAPLDVRSYVDENTHANVWTGYARFGAGFNDWRFAACGGVTGGTQLISTSAASGT